MSDMGAARPSYDPQDPFAPTAVRSMLQIASPAEAGLRMGPIEKIYLIWLAGGSCDGCTVAVVAATQPPVEKLIAGLVPGLPRVELIHPGVALEAGAAFTENLAMAERGELDAPYLIVWEGSVFENDSSGEGAFYRLGQDRDGRTTSSTEWLSRLAPNAAAVVAIGSCAAWGGIPAAQGNVTGSVGVMDFLERDYRSALGVPVVNIPGCSPVGDNFMETAAGVLLFLQGMGPLPEFDELGRPVWIFGETVHRRCPRGGYYEEGIFAEAYGEKECLVELGCWGPVVQCNISERGMVNGIGGCMNIGGICIGCTMPGFPDKFAPFYAVPPGTLVSATTSRVFGGFIRRMRGVTQQDKNITGRWEGKDKPSGWARFQSRPTKSAKLVHKLYRAYQNTKIGN